MYSIHIYIYIYRERERESTKKHIYKYMYIQRERERAKTATEHCSPLLKRYLDLGLERGNGQSTYCMWASPKCQYLMWVSFSYVGSPNCQDVMCASTKGRARFYVGVTKLPWSPIGDPFAKGAWPKCVVILTTELRTILRHGQMGP